MKKTLIKLVIFIVLLGLFIPCISGQDKDRDAILIQLMVRTLSKYHYSPKALDDKFSKQVFELYLKDLDGNKRYLLKSDITRLRQYETQLDEQIKQGRTDLFDLANDIMRQRIREVQAFSAEMLRNPMALTVNETLETDPDKSEYSATKEDLKNLWRKQLKYQVLLRYQELIATQEKETGAKISLTEKEKFQPKLEAQAREALARSIKKSLDRLLNESDLNRFERYVNAIASCYDPHTQYFSPQSKEDFDIQISGSLEGIGAVIKEDGDYVKVESIVPGSPASRQKDLQAGDTILKVGQGSAEPVDVVNMSVNDAVQLIRGKRGTEVRLTVKKSDGRILVIPIIRDVVTIEETYAKGVVLSNQKVGKRFGYIHVPSFYHDYNNRNGRNAAEDVRDLLDKMKDEKVSGVILDLRDDGGGILDDAVRMSGLFIKSGPVVQIKDSSNRIETEDDPDPDVVYSGPLVVLINSLSASASEILAAALQDYGRAVIVGGPSSFGKGTVQSFVELDDLISPGLYHGQPLGSLKLTIRKFYRINGGTTQYKGVTADIALPAAYSYQKIGERFLDNSLPWDTIKSSSYRKWSESNNIAQLKSQSLSRVKSDESFRLITENVSLIKQQQENTKETLQFTRFIAKQDRLSQEVDKLKKLPSIPYLKMIPLKSDPRELHTTDPKKNQEWLDQLNRDPYVNEASFILNDMIKGK